MAKRYLLAAGLLTLIGAALIYVQPMLASAVGLAARQACSLHHAAGLPIELARSTYIDRHIRPVGPLVSIKITSEPEGATASFLSIVSATAIRRPGYGCVLDHGEPIESLATRVYVEPEPVSIDKIERKTRFDEARLEAALNSAFREPTAENPRQTMAVVVLSNGSLVAEQYAPGIDQQTPLPGFSMAKSMTATLIGLLAMQEGLDVEAVVQGAGKLSEAAVTFDQLLRMTSGIGIDEDGSGRDANSIMLTQVNDAAAYAREQPLFSPPGTAYAYNGGGPVILSKAFVQLAGGGDPSAAFSYVDRHLLQPLKLRSVVLETDGAGTFLGSSFMLATAVEWARLGQLYLQHGNWQGKQILPENWTEYVSRKTEQSGARDYGAGFWTAVTGGRDSRHEQLPTPPADAYFMHGMMNQAVYMLPSQSLVIVRLGATRSYLQSGEWELVADVVNAMR